MTATDFGDLVNRILAGLLGSDADKVYRNVNPVKDKATPKGTRYSFVQEGESVLDCAKRLFAHYVERGEAENGARQVARICFDIELDTHRSYYTLDGSKPHQGKQLEEAGRADYNINTAEVPSKAAVALIKEANRQCHGGLFWWIHPSGVLFELYWENTFLFSGRKLFSRFAYNPKNKLWTEYVIEPDDHTENYEFSDHCDFPEEFLKERLEVNTSRAVSYVMMYLEWALLGSLDLESLR